MGRHVGAALALTCSCLVARAGAIDVPQRWQTYRSERFGYAFSHPPELEARMLSDGQSGEIVDRATGAPIADLEIWPAGDCPTEAKGTTAKRLGMERAAVATQADGPGSSSACGDPVVAREGVGAAGVRYYELELTCVREESEGRRGNHALIRRAAGKKGPTFFVDVAQPWRARVLMVDPPGSDPRRSGSRLPVEVAVIRRMLGTFVTFEVARSPGVCIEDLRQQGPQPGP